MATKEQLMVKMEKAMVAYRSKWHEIIDAECELGEAMCDLKAAMVDSEWNHHIEWARFLTEDNPVPVMKSILDEVQRVTDARLRGEEATFLPVNTMPPTN